MNLLIDTSLPKKTAIILDEGHCFYLHTFFSEFHQAEKLLKKIDWFFGQKKITVKNLKGIVVVVGPGPFTALRIGIIVANTLGYALNIKTAGLKQSDFSSPDELIRKGRIKIKKAKGFKILKPYYGKEPNITISKK